jgi:phospholipid/cholesterol/gamma-HCH transport system substrate-binding protein
MKTHAIKTIKLGIFVLAGLLFLIVLLYMIGRNQNLFGKTFVLKTRFANVQGLVSGNNVRYAGIEVGTVKKIIILNDTTVEVVMIIENNMKPFIRNNAIASIGSDGLMGNKVINISSSGEAAEPVKEEDILSSRSAMDTDEMLRTLAKTNNDVGIIADNLKNTVMRINNSTALWSMLSDSSLPKNISASAVNVQVATARAADMAADLQGLIKDVKNGKGSVGAVLTDTLFAKNLSEAIDKIKLVGENANELAVTINSAVAGIQRDVNNGKGTVTALLKDSMMVVKLNSSLANIEKGTDAFNQNMEALKHNFLLRGYFRKLERQQKKESEKRVVTQ